ncbi:MAG: hypothetical protein ACYTG5_14705, partial [Planctomycetota bacterium]
MVKTAPSIIFALSLALVACNSESPGADEILPPLGETIQMNFDWPVPGQASVKRRSSRTYTGPGAKPDREVTTRFILQISEAPEGELLLLEHRNLEFLEFNGVDTTAPEVQGVVAPMAAQYVVGLPVIHVHPNGDYAGIGDWDAHMRRVEPMLLEMVDNALMEPAVVEGTLRLMRQPSFRVMAVQKSADPWNAWVGAWVGMQFEQRQPLEIEHMQPVGMTELPQKLVYIYEGEDSEYPGHARLRMTVEMEGRELASVVDGLMGQVAAAMS